MLTGRMVALASSRARGHDPRVRPAPLLLALALGALLAGCGGPDERPDAPVAGEEPDASHEPAQEAGEAQAKREAEAREAAALLPLEAGRVLWYRATTTVSTPQGPAPYAREVALFTTRGPSGEPVLELVGGLAAPWDELGFWRGPREVVALFETGAGGGSVFLKGREPTARGGARLWTPDPTWDASRGRRLGWEQVGEWRALRTEHGRASEQLLRTWLARDVGVVQLEVVEKEVRALLLELVERGPRGAPGGGYDASSPGALWKSVTVALRRLDVDAFDALLGPALRRRERRAGWDEVRDLVPPAELRRARADPEAARDRELAARICAEVGDLLSLDVKLRGAWQADPRDPTLVTAPALVTQLEAGEPHLRRARVVLGRHGDTWSWDDLRLLE